MRFRISLLLWGTLLLCGATQANPHPSPAPPGQVITLGKPDHSVASGDVIVHSPAAVTGLGFSHDGSTLLVARNKPDPKAGAEAGPIEIWSLPSLQRKQTLGPPRGWVTHAVLAPDGKTFACLVEENLQIWDWQAGRKTYEIGLDNLHSDQHTRDDSGACDAQSEATFAFLNDNSILYTGMKHKRLMHLDTATGEIQPTDVKFPQLSNVAFSPDGKQIAVSMYAEQDFPNGFVFYDVKTTAQIRVLPFVIDNMFDIVFFSDGKRLLTIAQERNKVIEIATGKVLYSLPSFLDYGPAIFSPDGKLLATVGKEVTYVWKTDTGEMIAELPYASLVTALAFAPDGRRLAIGYFDSTIKLWAFN